MSFLIVGSKAINHNLGYTYRTPKDTDIICTYEHFQSEVQSYKKQGEILSCLPLSGTKYVLKTKSEGIIEYDIAWGDGESNDLILEQEKGGYASLEMLYMIFVFHYI